MPQPLGGVALRAALQAVRKARQSFPSSSIAFASRHWMSLACDCWVEQALEVSLDSTSLMVVEQQFSASAKATEHLSSIPLRYRWHAGLWLHLLVPSSRSPHPEWCKHRGPLLP